MQSRSVERIFPDHVEQIHELYLRDEAFKEMCADHEVLIRQLEALEPGSANQRQKLALDILESLRGLEEEIAQTLSRHGERVRPEAGSSEPTPDPNPKEPSDAT